MVKWERIVKIKTLVIVTRKTLDILILWNIFIYIFSEWHNLSRYQVGKHPPWWRWSHCSHRLWALKVNTIMVMKRENVTQVQKTDRNSWILFSWQYFQGVSAPRDRAKGLLLLRDHWVHGARGGEGRQPWTRYCEYL